MYLLVLLQWLLFDLPNTENKVIYKIAFSCNFLVFSKKVDKFKKKFDVLTQKFVIFTQKVEIFRHNLGILPKLFVNFCQKVGILRKKSWHVERNLSNWKCQLFEIWHFEHANFFCELGNFFSQNTYFFMWNRWLFFSKWQIFLTFVWNHTSKCQKCFQITNMCSQNANFFCSKCQLFAWKYQKKY